MQAVVQPPPTPAELKDWASNTLFISVMGMAYCGSRQAWRNKQLGEQEFLLSVTGSCQPYWPCCISYSALAQLLDLQSHKMMCNCRALQADGIIPHKGPPCACHCRGE